MLVLELLEHALGLRIDSDCCYVPVLCGVDIVYGPIVYGVLEIGKSSAGYSEVGYSPIQVASFCCHRQFAQRWTELVGSTLR